METTGVSDDGTTTIRMTAAEARAVRDDLSRSRIGGISPASDYLERLLATIHGETEVIE